MKFILLIIVVISQMASAQVGSWREFPVNCDTTEYSLQYVSEEGHYVGLIKTTGEFIYSIDSGQTWMDLCPEDDHRTALQTVVPNSQEYFFSGRRFVNKYNFSTNVCEQLFEHNSFLGLGYPLLLESGKVVALNNSDHLLFFDSDGTVEEDFNLGPNLRYEQIHFELGQPSYVTYNKSSLMQTCQREIDLENQSLGPEIVMSRYFESRLVCSGGTFFSSSSYSNDQGLTWIDYTNVDPTEEILVVTVDGNNVLLFGETKSYYSSDRGESFTSYIHNITFGFRPLLSATIIDNEVTIYDRNRFNSFVATSTNFGASWTSGIAFLDVPSNWDIVASTSEGLITGSDCGKFGYNPDADNWQDFNASVFSDVKALPNDNLLLTDFGVIVSVSTDNGTNWSELSIQPIEGHMGIVCKQDIVYIAGFVQTIFSTDNGVTFNLWEPPFNIQEQDVFDLFSNRKIIIYDRNTNEEKYILYDYTTGETKTLDKSFNEDNHVDVATTWSGTTVYILEYRDESLSEMVLYTSNDEGRNFDSRILPFSIIEGGSESLFESDGNISLGQSEQGVEMITDQNGNIIIYNNKKIFISQDLGNSWLDVTPTIPEMRTITGLTTSFDDCLYISTYGTGILKFNCKLNEDFGTCVTLVDNDNDGILSDVDCDDNNAAIFPGATESCNGVDDNCDGQIDEGFTMVRYYQDLDGDGYGNSINSLLDCAQPSGYVALQGDCDDTNSNINPGLTEMPYNGIDDDCNSATLDDDLDQDGFPLAEDCDDMVSNINPGQMETPYNGTDDDCNPTTLDDDLDQDGFPLADDCNDNESSINPGAVEILDNGIDEDCDGMDGMAIVDNDGDGFLSDVDCDDNDPLINSGATESCNGIDDNCDGQIDEGFVVVRYYQDLDGDGYGSSINSLLDCAQPSGYVALQGDCDDTNSNIHPGQTEMPYNGIDDDCNSVTLDDDLDQDGFLLAEDCNDMVSNINPGQMETPYNGLDDDCNPSTLDDDLDQDGFLLAEDCNDNASSINPGAVEILDNGIDEDCDGMDATAAVDSDGDGFLSDVDCNDNDPLINPDVSETCNGIDDNCDGQVDEGLIVQRYFEDLDGDGYGGTSNSLVDCQPPAGFVALQGDCDDSNASIFPGQTEAPYNGVDDDCDPATLDDDLDGDGFVMANDCDDNNPDVNSAQMEIPYNGVDDDCDPTTLEDDLDQDGFALADDCDDDNALINPNQEEEPYNGIDDDCDATTLDNDLDQDGFLMAEDCDDNNPNINPAAEEIPNNGIDEDCDGMDLISATHELSNSTVSIYPNPATDVINIEVNGSLKYESILYDYKGKTILTNSNQSQIGISWVPRGIYLLEIKDLTTGSKVVERIVIGK